MELVGSIGDPEMFCLICVVHLCVVGVGGVRWMIERKRRLREREHGNSFGEHFACWVDLDLP